MAVNHFPEKKDESHARIKLIGLDVQRILHELFALPRSFVEIVAAAHTFVLDFQRGGGLLLA